MAQTALDVRVVLCVDEAGRRCVEVATALSLPRRFEYMAARRYKKMLWGEKMISFIPVTSTSLLRSYRIDSVSAVTIAT